MIRKMIVRTLVVSLVVVSVLTAPALAGAQTGEGSLRGYIKDEQGGVLPGVTVTATSPALLAPVVAVTDTEGYYRLLNLPPGTYRIKLELVGFATILRDGILMRAGATFSIDFEMKVGALEETITVSGESPMVETGNPGSVMTIQGELVRAAPMTSRRLFTDVVEMAPGVRTRNVTGGYPGRAIYFHGAHIYSHAFQLEGAPASSFFDSAAHSMNTGGDLMQDAELKLGGADAASPLSTGVVMNVITPRGGNQFSGSVAYTYQPLSWNGDNTEGGRVKGGFPTVQATKQWDLSLGGPIVKDKVWFFSAYRYSDLTNGISRTATDLGFLRAFRPDFQPFDSTYGSHQPFVKVTTQLSQKHELAAFYQYDRNHILQGIERDADSLQYNTLGGGLMQGKVTSVWTNHFASQFSVAYSTKGGADKETYNRPYGVGPQVFVHREIFFSAGLPIGTGRLIQMNNLQSITWQPASMAILRGDLTYFREDWGGSHEFKTGIWAAPRLALDFWTRYLNEGFVLEEVRQIDRNEPAAGLVPFHRQYRTPTEVHTLSARQRDVGVYVQDSWKPHPRLTANVGLRVDFIRRRDALFNIDRMKSVEVGPRAGVSYLLTSDARTVLRASYGRIAEQVNGRDFVTRFGEGLPRGATIRDLYDVNADGIFETEIVTPAATAEVSEFEFDPDLHQPYIEDFIVGLRRQFRGQISVDVSATRRYYRDGYGLVDINGIYPDGPFQPFGGFGKVDPKRGLIYQQRNQTWNAAVFTILEAVVAKNLANNVQFLVSLNRQWSHESGTWNPTDPARFIQPDAFPNNRMLMLGFGNADHNTLDGRGQTQVNAYRPYSVSVAGRYFAPWGFMLAGSYMLQAGDYSGTIVTRLPAPDPRFGPARVVLADGTTQPNPLATTIRFAYPTRSEGQVRNETVRYLQLTLSRVFKVRGRQELEAMFNVFNLFNSGAHTNYQNGSNQLYSPNYLQPFNRYPPRGFAVGGRYRF